MDEIRILQDLAARANGGPAKPPLPDLRLAVRAGIAARMEEIESRQNFRRMLTLVCAGSIAALAMLSVGLYAFSGMTEDLSWNSQVMHLLPF